MNGRHELDEKYEKKAMNNVSGNSVLTDYFYSLSSSSASTKESYTRYVKDYFSYLEGLGIDTNNYNSFTNITIGDINRYLASDNMRFYYVGSQKKEMSESIRASRFYAVKNFFEYLISYNYSMVNPCDKVKPPKDKKIREVVYMDDNDKSEVRSSIMVRKGLHADVWNCRDMLIFTLGCRTGLRKSALIGINIEDINLEENKILVIEKGNVTKYTYFGDDTKDLIIKWLEYRKEFLGNIECSALFISDHKKRISPRSLSYVMENITKHVGKHITPHKMRSTCAIDLYKKTGDAYLVAEVLGHKNIQNTKRYITVFESEKINAARILDNM